MLLHKFKHACVVLNGYHRHAIDHIGAVIGWVTIDKVEACFLVFGCEQDSVSLVYDGVRCPEVVRNRGNQLTVLVDKDCTGVPSWVSRPTACLISRVCIAN